MIREACAPVADSAAMSEPAVVPRARLDSLTGLRFFAAFVVLGVHFALIFFWRSPSLRTAPKVFVQGAVGVSFFFILSGFVLTWSHQEHDTARSFIRRRLARIGPLHVGTWLLALIICLFLSQVTGVGQGAVALFLLAPWSPYWSTHLVLNVPAWSLGCELFFYLMFPFVFAGLRRVGAGPRRAIALACVAGAVLVAVAVNAGAGETHNTYWLLYFFPPTRMLEFVLGMALALEVAEGRLPRVGLIPATFIAGVAYIAAGQAPTPYQPVAVTVVPFALLIVAAAQADAAGRTSIYRLRPLVTLGVWSFAIYLVHWPVIDVMSTPIHRRLSAFETVGLGLAFLVISVVAAGILHAVIERPLEARLRGSRPRAESEPHATAVVHPTVEAVRP